MATNVRKAREEKYLHRWIVAEWFTTENSSIDDNLNVPPGTIGKVEMVDDAGTLAVTWLNGSSLGVIVQDRVRVVTTQNAYEQALRAVRLAYERLRPVLHERIVEVVRSVDPAIPSLAIEPTDQGGPGWVYGGPWDALHDDDELSALLQELGEVFSSEDNPAQEYRLDRPPWQPEGT